MMKKGIISIKHHDIIMAFIVPMFILCVVFALHRIYPFGSRSIVDNDLYLQYLPIMTALKRTLDNGESLFYSFYGGLGADFYSLNTYQNASPLTLLFLLLFDLDHMVLCVTLLIMVKLSFAGATMYWYLKKIAKYSEIKSRKILLISFSTLYALGGYGIAYYYNVMWLDAMILLPVVVYAMRRVIDGENDLLYVTSLSLMIISNYYLGLIMCIFLFFYFFVYFFRERKERFIKALLRIGLLSLVSLMISAVVILPTILTLKDSVDYALLSIKTYGLLYYPALVHVGQLLPCSIVTSFFGPANVYSGLISLLLLPLYLLNKEIDKRKRILNVLFIIFIFISTNFIPLDNVWHLFHIPNGIPGRYSFVLTFMLMEVAVESIDCLNTASRKEKAISFLFVALLYLMTIFNSVSFNEKSFMYLTGIIFMSFYLILFYYIPQAEMVNRELLMSGIIIFEILFVAIRSISISGVMENDRYFYRKEEITRMIEIANEIDPYARMEIFNTDHYNAPYVYGYKGISVFSSSISADTYEILSRLMYDKKPDLNMFVYKDITIIPDSLFNVRFYISLDEKLDRSWLKPLYEIDGCYLYENNYYSSLGYVLDKDTSSVDFKTNKENILNNIVGINTGINNILSGNSFDMDKWDVAYKELFDEKLKIEKLSQNYLLGSVDVKEDGIMFMSIPYDSSWKVKVDGQRIDDMDVMKYFISFPIEKGYHEIEMSYVPEGFNTGVVLSLCGIISYILYERFMK